MGLLQRRCPSKTRLRPAARLSSFRGSDLTEIEFRRGFLLPRACLQSRTLCSWVFESVRDIEDYLYFHAAVVLGLKLRRQGVEQRLPEDGPGRSAHGVWGVVGVLLHSGSLCGWRRAGDGPPEVFGPDGHTPASNLRILQAERAALTFQERLFHETVQHSVL